MTNEECEKWVDEKIKMSYFLDSFENLCKQYGVHIESFCDKKIGIPRAVVSFNGSNNFYNINTHDMDYSFGEKIDC